jgi:peptidoglycan hydrolase-like protein with peptidoglycan-binding domain
MSPYAFGTRSDQTRALQAALAERGLYPGEIDGIFGRGTRTAVVAARAMFRLAGEGVDTPLLRWLGLVPDLPNPLSAFFTRLLLGKGAAIVLNHLKGLLQMSFLSGYRTYIVAAAMLLAGIAGMLGVDIPNFTGQAPGNLVMEALAFFFLRQGLKTNA